MEDELVDQLRGLVGKAVVNVRYWDGSWDYDMARWDQHGERFDRLDGLELDFADGSMLSISSNANPGSEPLGLVACTASVLDQDPYYSTDGTVWDVSVTTRWAPLLRRGILDVLAYEAAGCPLQVELVFEGDHRALLVSATVAPDDTFASPGFDVLVFFDAWTAGVARAQAMRHPGIAPVLGGQSDPSGLEPTINSEA
jgi:hypothetical protein